MSTEYEIDKRLLALQESYERDDDVIAVWEAIRFISLDNEARARRGDLPYPMPDWVSAYLAKSAKKIIRLQIGIDPDDDRTIADIGFDQAGQLRMVRESDGKGEERFRDKRGNYIGRAFGLVGKTWNAFARHDQLERDDFFLEIYDASLEDHLEMRKDIRTTVLRQMEKQGGMSTAAAMNRLSKARNRKKTHRT